MLKKLTITVKIQKIWTPENWKIAVIIWKFRFTEKSIEIMWTECV